MKSSFDLLHIERNGISTLYDVEFIVEREIQSLLTIEVAGGCIQDIYCYPVDSSSKVRVVMNDRNGRTSAFVYSGEYFPEGRITYLLDRAIDEYDDEMGGDL